MQEPHICTYAELNCSPCDFLALHNDFDTLANIKMLCLSLNIHARLSNIAFFLPRWFKFSFSNRQIPIKSKCICDVL